MKHLSLNKYLKLTLTLSVVIAFVLALFGGWATHRQETYNDPIFWDLADARTVNAVGVATLIIGWGFWEYFVSSKAPKMWTAFVGMGLALAATVMINGVWGLVGGSIALVLMGVIFFLMQQAKVTHKGAK